MEGVRGTRTYVREAFKVSIHVGDLQVKAKPKSLWIVSSLNIGGEKKEVRNYICSSAKSPRAGFQLQRHILT